MQITYFGHSCFSVEIDKSILLFDPFITGNPLAKDINLNDIKADFIFISHGHQDHVGDVIEIANNTNATVVSNFEVINWLESKGLKKTHSMNIGGKCHFDFGTIKFMNAAHSSSMPDGTYGGNPGGFLVESAEGKFYFAGDTGLTYDLKLIGEFVHLDFVCLPIGNNFTMGVDNAIIASDFLKCENIIGMHYDTFPIITIDKEVAFDKFSRAGKNLTLLNIGQTININ
ncbi:MAG: metal-dependent hydrolase [Bacteroidetes bacterium]|nr:metal-dependent hydrolase [Bacteroidota bacterium]